MTVGDHPDVLTARLSALRRELTQERSLPTSERRTGATDASLDAAGRHLSAVATLWAEDRTARPGRAWSV